MAEPKKKATWREKLFLNLLQTSSMKSFTSIYTKFMTLNTSFIQYKFENTTQKRKKKKNPLLQNSVKHHTHHCKFQPLRKPAANFSTEVNDKHTSRQAAILRTLTKL